MQAEEKPERSARFWNKVAERYAKSPVGDEAAYQRKLEITRGYFRPEMEVLEFGCGTGTTALIHAPYVKHIRATDFSSEMIRIARGKAVAQGIENVSFEQAGIDTLEAPEASLDAVLGLNVLHLLADKEAVIAKVHRMLKPGGVFVSSNVCLGGSLLGWLLWLAGPLGRALGLMPLLRIFSPQQLLDSLTDAGFEIDHEWRPNKGWGMFIVAKKPG